MPFDVIALSYYPIFQGPLSALQANLDELAGQFGKPIIIAENQYSWTLANGDQLGNSTWQTSQLIDGYPASPGGQQSIVNDELSMLAALPHGLGAGLFYWAPEWLPGVSWAPDASPPGTPDDNETLFDFTGHGTPLDRDLPRSGRDLHPVESLHGALRDRLLITCSTFPRKESGWRRSVGAPPPARIYRTVIRTERRGSGRR